jgi:hypothetical protein
MGYTKRYRQRRKVQKRVKINYFLFGMLAGSILMLLRFLVYLQWQM